MSLSSIVSLNIPKQLNHNMCEFAQKCGFYYIDLSLLTMQNASRSQCFCAASVTRGGSCTVSVLLSVLTNIKRCSETLTALPINYLSLRAPCYSLQFK